MATDSPGVPLPSQESAGDLYLELLSRTADAVVVYERDGFTACNEAAVRLFGLERTEQLLQLHPSDVSPPTQPDGRDSFERANELLAHALEHGSHRFEWTHARADGTPLACEVLLTPIRIDGRILVHAVIRDLSAVKALEAQLLHAQRLDALGRLAGGIAHDFNNLLAVLLGHAELLGDHLDGSADASEHLAELQNAGERAATLVRELLLFSRREPPELRTVDLGTVLQNALPMLRSLVGEKVRVDVRQQPGPLPIRADVVRLEQVMLNLAANARDAMPEGGRLRIECGAEGDRIRLAFADEGSGMPEEVVAQAFEPFFTTKGVGGGTGLGLSTVYGIVTQHGGEVSIDSRLGAGTRMEISLPANPGAAAATAEVAPDEDATAAAPCILVVEDEDAVRRMVCQSLRRAGYRVLDASDGVAALERLATEPDVDLVLSDVAMPRMDGHELARRLFAEDSTLPILLMSGHATDAGPGGASAAHSVLAKPFQRQELLDRVSSALELRTGRAGTG